MNGATRDTATTRGVRAAFGTGYVAVPVIASVTLITPVLALTTSPVGVHPGASLALAAVFALSLLLPLVGAVPALSRLVPRRAIITLAVAMSVLSISWISLVGWSFTLGAHGGRIELLASRVGFSAALICATVSVWPATLSALSMAIPNRHVRVLVVVATALLGLATLLISIPLATT